MARSKRKPQTKADLFDRILLEASEFDLQELVENAPRWFADHPLELLREYKFLVDTRLGAEPETKVFYRDDPHEVRVRYWHRIADRLAAEINLRSSRETQNGQGAMATRPQHEDISKFAKSAGATKDHGVAARRVLVSNNRDASDHELCEILDRERISLPRRWSERGFKGWAHAWSKQKRQIHVIFSKDRNAI